MEMIGYIGIGVDETPASNELQLRIVCTPGEGTSVDELQSQWDRFADAAAQCLESEESGEEAGDEAYSLEVASRLLKMQCQRIGGDGNSMPAGIAFSGKVPLP